LEPDSSWATKSQCPPVPQFLEHGPYPCRLPDHEGPPVHDGKRSSSYLDKRGRPRRKPRQVIEAIRRILPRWATRQVHRGNPRLARRPRPCTRGARDKVPAFIRGPARRRSSSRRKNSSEGLKLVASPRLAGVFFYFFFFFLFFFLGPRAIRDGDEDRVIQRRDGEPPLQHRAVADDRAGAHGREDR